MNKDILDNDYFEELIDEIEYKNENSNYENICCICKKHFISYKNNFLCNECSNNKIKNENKYEFTEGLGLKIIFDSIKKFNNFKERKDYICNEILKINEFKNIKKELIENAIQNNKTDGYAIIGAIGDIINWWE